MCDTASLELSKDLYKLSGWDGTEKFWMKHAVPEPPYSLVRDGEYYRFGDKRYGSSDIPAYDLGYLLRKLPKDFHLYPIPGAAWQIQYWSRSIGKEIIKQADTPEDAACLLAIELFQQGILKREQE